MAASTPPSSSSGSEYEQRAGYEQYTGGLSEEEQYRHAMDNSLRRDDDVQPRPPGPGLKIFLNF